MSKDKNHKHTDTATKQRCSRQRDTQKILVG